MKPKSRNPLNSQEGWAGLEPARKCLTGTRSAAELPTPINQPLNSRKSLDANAPSTVSRSVNFQITRGDGFEPSKLASKASRLSIGSPKASLVSKLCE